MKILHDKYIEENEHFQISYSVFCRLRPFWTVANSVRLIVFFDFSIIFLVLFLGVHSSDIVEDIFLLSLPSAFLKESTFFWRILMVKFFLAKSL
jgi:hypothetical protein